jgi:hypothetical protein
MQLTTGGTLDIRPGQPRAQVDDPVGIIVAGCEPHAHVIIDASVDWAGSVYASSRRYTADDQGEVDTATQSSHAGTYTGVDPSACGGRGIQPSQLRLRSSRSPCVHVCGWRAARARPKRTSSARGSPPA